ncbi:carboxypeptidase-like regulatory domain-containing protein [Siccationidurans ginsengisoli]|nr:carboxypeptidase-like regulatory domain-containing protein [Hymenobacter sp. BT559]
MAASNRPSSVLPVTKLAVPSAVPAVVSLEAASAVAPAAARTVLVHGRILNEKGEPLAGATVLRKGTAHGTSTDAQGNYSLRVPADGLAMLQYGYGGYTEQEVAATQSTASATVTLQPKAPKRRHWLFF